MATFTLSTLDQGAPPTYLRYTLTFACSVEEVTTTIEKLDKAVRSLISEIPMLAGNVAFNDEQKPVITATLQQVESFSATIKDCSGSVPGYTTICRQNAPPKHITGVDLTPLADDPDAQSSLCCAIQANFIDGGLILVIYLHHAAADVKGISTILRLMSEGLPVRKLDQEALDLEAKNVTQARARLSDGSGAPAFLALAREIERRQQRSTEQGSDSSIDNKALAISDNITPEAPSTRGVVLSFKLNIITQTAEMINSRRLLRDSSITNLITPREVLIAILWRAYVRAKWPGGGDADDGTHTSVSFPVDLRGCLEPPLDSHWMGNAVSTTIASENLLRLAMAYDVSTLEHTAIIVHTSVSAAASDLLARSKISLMNTDPFLNHAPTAQLVVHDWTAVPAMEDHEMDLGLGLGPPDAIRRTGRAFGKNEVVLLPENQQTQAWEVQIELEQRLMTNMLRDDLLRGFVWHVAR